MGSEWETVLNWIDDQTASRDSVGLVKMIEKFVDSMADWEIEDCFKVELEADGFYEDCEDDYLDYNLTYDEAVVRFNEGVAQHIIGEYGADDRIALAEGWNNWTDRLCKDGEITDFQYNNWDNPF